MKPVYSYPGSSLKMKCHLLNSDHYGQHSCLISEYKFHACKLPDNNKADLQLEAVFLIRWAWKSEKPVNVMILLLMSQQGQLLSLLLNISSASMS